MTGKTSIALIVAALGSWSCASTPPPPLKAAREAYTRASTGLPAHLSPADLYQARKALDQANREYEAHGDTTSVQDHAYIAYRKIELAEVRARTEMDRQKLAEAARLGVMVRDRQVNEARAELARTREELNAERRANARLEAQRSDAQQAEGQARAAADARLNGAMRDLSQRAQVHEDTRGVVITFNGAELFPFGNYTLLETARPKLDQVAEALNAQGENKQITVEGHTDNAGSAAINLPLSENRANAVRDYLISAGIEPGRISAVGRGGSRPIVDNRTAESRAANRRVEIIIEGGSVSAR
jgi:outer membrane protein OmpA-like peptidoglycan-associated protein